MPIRVLWMALVTVVLAGASIFALQPRPAHAIADNAPVSTWMRVLNGTPVRQGVCTSGGSSATVAVTAGEVVMVECDAAAHVGIGASCSATATAAAYCPKLNAAPDRFFLTATGTSLSCISSSGTANCAYFYMR